MSAPLPVGIGIGSLEHSIYNQPGLLKGLCFLGGIVGLGFVDFPQVADQEGDGYGGPFGVVQPNPDTVGRQIGRDRDGELS